MLVDTYRGKKTADTGPRWAVVTRTQWNEETVNCQSCTEALTAF